jgi:hypothetical protein
MCVCVGRGDWEVMAALGGFLFSLLLIVVVAVVVSMA